VVVEVLAAVVEEEEAMEEEEVVDEGTGVIVPVDGGAADEGTGVRVPVDGGAADEGAGVIDTQYEICTRQKRPANTASRVPAISN
jgi:hypothetical protein